MTKLKGITFESKILCEEIRQEKSNKLIIIGVYASNLLISKVPAHVPLALFIDTVIKTPGSGNFFIRISGPGKGKFTMGLNAETQTPDQQAMIITPRLDVLMECEGTLKVDVSSDKRRWKPLIRKSVNVASDLWSLAPTLPELLAEQSRTDAPES